MMSNWTFWARELNQKGCSFFQRDNTGRDWRVPPSYFSALWDFFRNFCFSKESPTFWYFATEWMLKKSGRIPTARQFGLTFGFFGYFRTKYLTLWSPCAILSLRYGADLCRYRLVLVHLVVVLMCESFLASRKGCQTEWLTSWIAMFRVVLKNLLTKIFETLIAQTFSCVPFFGSPIIFKFSFFLPCQLWLLSWERC